MTMKPGRLITWGARPDIELGGGGGEIVTVVSAHGGNYRLCWCAQDRAERHWREPRCD